jgi:hypothetical protein
MQQLKILSCGIFTIRYVADLTFGLDPKNKFTMCIQTHDKNKMVDHH